MGNENRSAGKIFFTTETQSHGEKRNWVNTEGTEVTNKVGLFSISDRPEIV